MKKIFVMLFCIIIVVSTMVACKNVNSENSSSTDLAVDASFFEDINKAYELGLMDGNEDWNSNSEKGATVIEGIALAAHLHADYNNIEIEDREINDTEIRFDFDDDSLVDTSGGRNARQKAGITFGRCSGTFDGGILTVKAGPPNSGGAFDPQISFNLFNVDSRDFDTVTVRMRVVERLPEVVEGVPIKNNIQFYFSTSTSKGYDNKKFAGALFDVEKENEWFDIVLDMRNNEYWKDTITSFRFDPPENHAIYELDYLVLSKNTENATSNWYDKYIDYAVTNNIIDEKQYYEKDYNNGITTAQLCELIARAIPEKHFNQINDIKGIPDVDRDSRNADIYLMLYKSGVFLGDEDGNFNAASVVKREAVKAIINRVAFPENRITGTATTDWNEQANEYDIEFNDESWLEKLSIEADSAKIENGALVLEALDKGEGQSTRFDTKISYNDTDINAKKYSKLKVRFKADIVEDSGNKLFDLYFTTKEQPNYNEGNAIHGDMFADSYKDAAGWYVLEIDLAIQERWKGKVISYRFEPTNSDGTFIIDYIRFIKVDPLLDASHKKLLDEGYVATGLMLDPDFERGFYVSINDNSLGKKPEDHGTWNEYSTTDEKPVWAIGPYFTRLDLWTDRDTTTDKYTLTDKEGISTVKYNPEEKSITLRLNGVKNYQGKPHIDGEYSWWPHLLLNQGQGVLTGDERKKNGADADRIFMEIDVRVLDYKDTINKEGHNSLTFPIFFYLFCDDAPGAKIWFGGGGIIHSKFSSSLKPAWTTDSAAHQYIYGTPMADMYNGMQNSFNVAPGLYMTGEEWKHIRIDLTPHLERCIEWANRDNAYGVKVSKENLYFAGGNIGFEIHGNYDCTVEFKNFNLISYRKGE